MAKITTDAEIHDVRPPTKTTRSLSALKGASIVHGIIRGSLLLAQRIASIDKGNNLSSLKQLVQKEQVYAIGPLFSLTPLKNLLLTWASVWEIGAKNRSEGFRTTFRVLYGF